jgi:hypothetical protein
MTEAGNAGSNPSARIAATAMVARELLESVVATVRVSAAI